MSRYQNYPRSDNFLDESLLVPHAIKLSPDQLRTLIIAAIRAANAKSSQVILAIPPDVTEAQLHTIYEREGKKLFRYFKDYSPDPPATAHQIKGKTYLEVGQD
ncbi:MAG: hypothetical protein SF029_03410, partial [bacterium]|nr:hypothetical protein [bacterium]